MPGTDRPISTVFEDHLKLRAVGDVEGDILRNYSENVVLLSTYGVFKGHAGVRESAHLLSEHLGKPELCYGTRLVDHEIAFLEWKAHSHGIVVDDGVDTFLIRGGLILTQTIHYTLLQSSRA